MNTQGANESSQISAESYQQLVERVDRLEKLLLKLIEIAETRNDVQAMREAEIEYRSGDAAAFHEQVAELTRHVEALEARLGEAGDADAFHEVKPVYQAASDVADEGVVIPAKVLRASGLSPQELLVELAVHLFEEDFISLGVAKSLAGMNTARFMKLLASRQIPLHYDVEELEEDIATLKRMGLL